MKMKFFLILILLCFTCSCSHRACASDGKKKPGQNENASNAASYFPLNQGNRWTYRCSVEGEFQFEKAIRIVSVTTRKKTRLYKVESKTTTNEKPFVYYLFEEKGKVFRTFDPDITEREPVITVDPKPGDRVDQELNVSRHVQTTTPATGKINALVVENFNPDQSANASNDLLDWRGFFYARGIGCIVEADGLGGECLLTDYDVRGQSQSRKMKTYKLVKK